MKLQLIFILFGLSSQLPAVAGSYFISGVVQICHLIFVCPFLPSWSKRARDMGIEVCAYVVTHMYTLE